MPPISKGEAYKQLISRMTEAVDAAFYLEASWIAYSIIEDRIASALELTGGPVLSKQGTPEWRLGLRLDELKRRQRTDADLRGSMLGGTVLQEVRGWKDKRNPLMHEMADEAKPFREHHNLAKALALDGEKAARALCDAVTRLRKRKQKGRQRLRGSV